MSVERVALVASDFEDGGVERNFANLAAGLARLGVAVRVLAGNPHHPYLAGLPEAVRVLPALGGRADAIAALMADERPEVILTGKLRDDCAALDARERLGPRLRPAPLLVAAVGTPLSERRAGRAWNPVKRWRDARRIARCYARLDGLAAISEGVAEDLRRRFGVHETPLSVLNNPIVPEDADLRAAAPCPHPWLREVPPLGPAEGRPPTIVAVGGLRKVKDFPTLLRAFARLPEPRARLLILGEGKERRTLEGLAERLGIAGRTDLCGFVADPFPYLARARLLVLSSTREGLGNVVVEALAVGTPALATDCSAGLGLLAAQGALPPLAPVGDPRALARAMASALAAAPDPRLLRAAAAPFGLPAASAAYLHFFRTLAGLKGRTPAPRPAPHPTG